MSLTPPPAEPVYAPAPVQKTENSFYSKVMLWLGISFATAAVGTFILGPLVPAALMMPLYFVVLIALIASAFARKAKKLMGVFAVVIPTILGVVLYPTLNAYVAAGAGNVVGMAALGTAFVFGVMAYWGWTSKKSMYRFMPAMFAIVLGIIVLSLLNAFLFQLPVLSFVISLAVVAIFSIYTFIDIQMIRDRVGADELPPSYYALNVFLDIYNLFTALLNIFGFLSND
jgi:FtsH-binding integral membrane protein